MTIHYILAAQHQTPLTPWESLQCVGFDGKSSPTSHCKSQSRSHAPLSSPLADGACTVSEAWAKGSFYKTT